MKAFLLSLTILLVPNVVQGQWKTGINLDMVVFKEPIYGYTYSVPCGGKAMSKISYAVPSFYHTPTKKPIGYVKFDKGRVQTIKMSVSKEPITNNGHLIQFIPTNPSEYIQSLKKHNQLTISYEQVLGWNKTTVSLKGFTKAYNKACLGGK